MLTFDVRIRKLQIRPERRRPLQVRWSTAGIEHSESYLFEEQADGRRAELMGALQRGEQFDTHTGLPASELRARDSITWYEHVVDYARMKWPHASAKHRAGIADALATVTPLLTTGGSPPAGLRHVLYAWSFRMASYETGLVPRAEAEELPTGVTQALEWMVHHSLPLSEATRPHHLRRALDALCIKRDGTSAAENTVRRKRMVLNNALRYAVECDRLPSNPLPRVDWQLPPTDIEIDFRNVPDPLLARDLIHAAGEPGPRGRHLEAFFGCLYYAAMRPAETAALTQPDCLLPDDAQDPEAWGELVLSKSQPEIASGWTDDSRTHDTRGLKRRARTATRSVPIPPQLVALLRAHLTSYGTAADGRLFRAAHGGNVRSTEYCTIWQQARQQTLSSQEAATPLANVPYSLRHAGISLWITAGVDPAEVARRAGHSLTVLYRVYAKPLYGHQHHANQLITDALHRKDQN